MYRVVSVQYFMDYMTDYEVDIYMDNLQYLDVNQWEQTRFLGYCNVQVNSKKKLSPQDLLTFSWEEEEHETEITDEQLARLQAKAAYYQKLLTNNGKELRSQSEGGHVTA